MPYRCDLGGSHAWTSKSRTSPATLVGISPGSKAVIGRVPLTPAAHAARYVARPTPLGLTAPIPATTTRSISNECTFRPMNGRFLLALLAAAALLACEDGGPTGFVRFDVTGPWTETATLVENTCAVEIPAVTTTELFFLQSGDVLRAELPGVLTAEGTIDERTGGFEIGFVAEFQNGTATYAQTG